MAVPSYTTDLIDIDLCEAGGKTWAEPTAVGWTFGAAPSSDDDNPFQGALSMSKAFNATDVGGQMVNNGAGITLPTDGAILIWFYWASPGSLYPDADGGIRVMAGSALNAFDSWDVGGSTTYVYGGWVNYAVNTGVPYDDRVSTGLGNSQYIGAAVNNSNSIFKGSPFLTDAVRYGRAQARMSGGESANYATFAGYAAKNDLVANRWGLIQAIAGGYQVKGLVLFGFSTKNTTYRARATNVATLTTSAAHGFVVGDTVVITGVGGTGYNTTAVITTVPTTTTFTYANTGTNEGSTADTGGLIDGVVDFRDSNKSLVIQATPKCTSNFNTFEVRNASSRVDLTAINITSLGTVSPGRWVTTDNADINIDTCVFTDMGTFGFQSNSTILTSTFRRCKLVTQNSAVFTSCVFDSTSDSTKALLSNNPSNVSSTTFISSGTKHAMEMSTATGATYYSSDVSPTDPQSVWTNDANAFDGSTATSASTSTAGSTSTNYLQAAGTNAPGAGSAIQAVYVRIYGSVASGDTLYATVATDGWADELGTASLTSTSASWGSFTTAALTTPPGGWDWTKVQALDTRVYKTGTAGTANAYRVDIAVFTGSYTFSGNVFTGYASSDGSTGDEAIYNNSSGPILINLTSGATPSVRNGTSASTKIVSSVSLEVNGVTKGTRILIEKVSDGTQLLSESATTLDDTGVTYKVTGSASNVVGQSVRVVARKVGYLPFKQTTTVPSGGLMVTAVWLVDAISDKVDTSDT
jgi:hypothetical protein